MLRSYLESFPHLFPYLAFRFQLKHDLLRETICDTFNFLNNILFYYMQHDHNYLFQGEAEAEAEGEGEGEGEGAKMMSFSLVLEFYLMN
jgi:hypothetical protein